MNPSDKSDSIMHFLAFCQAGIDIMPSTSCSAKYTGTFWRIKYLIYNIMQVLVCKIVPLRPTPTRYSNFWHNRWKVMLSSSIGIPVSSKDVFKILTQSDIGKGKNKRHKSFYHFEIPPRSERFLSMPAAIMPSLLSPLLLLWKAAMVCFRLKSLGS